MDRSEERRRNDSDAVLPAAGMWTGSDDGRIEEIFTDFLTQPEQVLHVIDAHTSGELHF